MRKGWLIPVLTMVLLLCGCEKAHEKTDNFEQIQVTTEATVPATIPADGDPGDVTCKGTYTGEMSDSVVATSGSMELTGEELQVWYWAEVSQYRQENHETAPDFDLPLDTQVCGIDSSVNS